jgi:hypothetical protein
MAIALWAYTASTSGCALDPIYNKSMRVCRFWLTHPSPAPGAYINTRQGQTFLHPSKPKQTTAGIPARKASCPPAARCPPPLQVALGTGVVMAVAATPRGTLTVDPGPVTVAPSTRRPGHVEGWVLRGQSKSRTQGKQVIEFARPGPVKCRAPVEVSCGNLSESMLRSRECK